MISIMWMPIPLLTELAFALQRIGHFLQPQRTVNGVAQSGFGYSNAINAGGQRSAQIVARIHF